MLVVGPVAAADSESNLRILRPAGAPRAASLRSSTASSGLTGTVVAAVSDAAMRSPCASGDAVAPPGFRHRRFASERA
jgi:hypothetical protein